MKKKILSVFLVFCMALTFLPTAALAASAETTIDEDTVWESGKTLSQDLTIRDSATLTVKGSITIQGTVTISGGTIQRGADYTGALIIVPENSSLTLANTVIDGGKESGISAQDAAIRVDGGALTLNNGAVIQNNNNMNNRENHYYHSGGWRYYNCGGGIAIYNDGTVTMNTGAEIKSNSITNSNYTKQTSGVFFSEDSALVKEGNSHSFGGGVGIYESGTFTMNGGIISGNSALKPDGVGEAYGGGVGLLSRGVDTDHASCNKTEGLRAKFVMNGGQVTNNTATSGGGGFRAADDQGDNKIDRKNHSVISINGGEISNNTTAGAGGGLLITYASLTVGGNAKIANNTATKNGGGIEVSNHSMLTMTGGNVFNNQSSGLGGGIHDSGAAATYDGTTEKTTLSISNVTFENNSATNGGAIYCKDSNSVVSIEQCVFSENQATSGNGGAIQNAGENLTITGCTISENTATSNGGGLYSSGKVSLSDTSVTNNTATTNGGGIYVSSANMVELSGKVVVKDNSTSSTGATDKGNLFVDHATREAAIKKVGDLSGSEIHFGLTGYYYDDSEQNHVDKTVLSGSEESSAVANDAMYMYCDAESYAPYFDSTDNTIKVGSAATITFNENHGESPKTSTQKVSAGKGTTLAPNPFIYPGHTFTGWNTSSDGKGTAYADKANISASANVTLYAQWNARQLSSIEVAAQNANVPYGTILSADYFTVTAVYDNGEREAVAEFSVSPSTPLTTPGTVQVTVTYQGKTQTCGITVDKASQAAPTSAPTLKDRTYTSITLNTVEPNANGAAAQYSKDGGKTWQDSAEFTDLTSNTTYTFAVRYAEKVPYAASGASATAEFSTLRYSSGGGSSNSGSSYAVSAPSAKNGDVTVSPKNAKKGDIVTITVTPDKGYELDTITVKDASGNKLKLTDKGNGKYTFTMPASKVTVSAEFVEEQAASTFADVPTDAYYAKAVEWAVKNGITNGMDNGLFGSNDPCTRGQIVTFLWRAAGSPEPKTTSSFADVAASSYYAKAVAWAIENGITTGTGDGTFSPDATCTRAQAVTFLARALNAKAAGKAEYSDVPADSYFADAVAWAAANGVTEGVGGGLFGPDNNCTRAQIVTFLYRAYQGK